MSDITISPEALEAAARKIAAVTMDMPNVGDRLPDTLWKQYLPEARAACLALIENWPGMEYMMGDEAFPFHYIILPLPEEPTNDK